MGLTADYTTKEPGGGSGRFSFFHGPITNTRPEREPVTRSWLADQTRTGMDDPEMIQWIEDIRFVRSNGRDDCEMPKLVQTMKRHLPAVTLGGVFRRRAIAGLLEPSGYTGVDLDHLEAQGHSPAGIVRRIEELQQEIPWVKEVFQTVGGDGLRVVIEMSPAPMTNEDMHRAYRAGHHALCLALGLHITLDTLPSSIASPSYMSYDPDLYEYDGLGALLWELVPPPVAEEAAEEVAEEAASPSAPGDQQAREKGTPPWEGLDPAVLADLDRQALSFVRPPEKYNVWLGCMPWLKSLGFTLEEVDAWSRQGSSYQEAEVAKRWQGLPSDDPDEARRKLWAQARKAGWQQPDLKALKQEAGESVDGVVTLESLTAPSQDTATEAANATRFLVDHADRLVVAYNEDDLLPADVYAYTERGTLSVGPLEGMMLETSGRHMALVMKLDKKALGRAEIVRHAQRFDNALRLPVVIANLRGAIARLRRADLLPESLVIKARSDINGHLQYMGAPNGVLNLFTGLMLPPDEARATFTTAQIPDPYDPEATHADVDVIMPEEPTSPEMEWWSKTRGILFTRAPAKEIIAMLTPPDSGKTVISNCDRDAFGPSYVNSLRPQTLQKSDYSGPSSYNNGLLLFGNGMRILYMPEAKGDIDVGLVNLVTGGERAFGARGIKEKDVMVTATAHIIMQSNVPEHGSADLRFGISSTSEDSEAAALRDRLYLLPMPQIPKDQQKKAYLSISAESVEFRQAWVARTVRQCMAMAGQSWPDRLVSQEDALGDLQHRETKPWRTEWLEHALVVDQKSEVNSKEVYQDYEGWYEANGGVKELQRTITAAMSARYGPHHDRKTIWWNGKRAQVTIWYGFALASVKAMEEEREKEKQEQEQEDIEKADQEMKQEIEKEMEEQGQA